MKMKIIIVLLALAAAMWQAAAAGELTFGWNLINETGNIRDMEFMPDNNYFIMSTVSDIQIRRTESGELVNTYPISAVGLEFTPDSTKLVLIYGSRIEIRNVSDMSLIREYVIPEGTDTVGYNIFQSSIRFTEIVVDPVRPYVYAIRAREGTLSGGKYFLIRRIVIYNYETMEDVGVLSTEEDYTIFEKMAISNDGKYLAANSALSSHLRVWDLETRQKIKDYKICDIIPGDNSGEPSFTKFSETNTDNIYFSGRFPLLYGNYNYNGILIYSILENKIIDTTFAVPPNFVYKGYFTLIDNEERAIKLDEKIMILNLKNKTIEQRINHDTITGGAKAWHHKLLYSPTKGYLVGYSTEKYSFGRYDNNTGTEDPFHYDSIIFPNPNTGFVSLQTNCQNENQSYDVLDINGTVLIPITLISAQTGISTIDISSLSAGTYFLRYYCGSSVTTYKIIKEG